MTVTVTEPGFYYSMDEGTYHSDPVPDGSLSSTMARLLTRHVPAKAFARRNMTPTKAMNLGTAAHLSVLGVGPELIVQRYDGRTKSGKAERATYAPLVEAGTHVVVTRAEYEQVTGMRAALVSHRAINLVLGDTRPEVSAFWRAGGTWLRARYDLLGSLAYDYKTTQDVSPRAFARAVGKYGYHQQADHYERGLMALDHPAADEPLQFICQETEPPYLVQVYTMDDEAREVARLLNDRAIRIFTECNSTGIWPGYDAHLRAVALSLPAFYITDHADMLPDWFGSSGDMDVPA